MAALIVVPAGAATQQEGVSVPVCKNWFSVRANDAPMDRYGFETYSINLWSNGNKGRGTISFDLGDYKAKYRFRQIGNDGGMKTYKIRGKIYNRYQGRVWKVETHEFVVQGCFDGTNFVIGGERFPVTNLK